MNGNVFGARWPHLEWSSKDGKVKLNAQRLIEIAAENGVEPVDVETEALMRINHFKGNYSYLTKFKVRKRIIDANLEYPVWIMADGDGVLVRNIDGNHRVLKANAFEVPFVKAYILKWEYFTEEEREVIYREDKLRPESKYKNK